MYFNFKIRPSDTGEEFPDPIGWSVDSEPIGDTYVNLDNYPGLFIIENDNITKQTVWEGWDNMPNYRVDRTSGISLVPYDYKTSVWFQSYARRQMINADIRLCPQTELKHHREAIEYLCDKVCELCVAAGIEFIHPEGLARLTETITDIIAEYPKENLQDIDVGAFNGT